jgi:phage terminase large subunit-like protein
MIFGGLDLASRVDNTALVVLKMDNGVLEQIGMKVWPHVSYDIIAEDLLKIQDKENCTKIGFDRSGVGDAVGALFDKSLPMIPIITTQQSKIAMIQLIKGMFQQKKLLIHSKQLYTEVSEQQQHISDAGNILYKHPANRHDDAFWALAYACNVASRYLQGSARPSIASSRINRGLDEMIDMDIDKEMRNF